MVTGPRAGSALREPRLLAFLCFALAACDVGTLHLDDRGPALRVTALSPENGEGVGCDVSDASCGVALNSAIRLELDRPLRPATAVRQSIAVYAGTPGLASPFLLPTYDVLERVVVFQPSSAFERHVLYRIDLPVAKAASDLGLRAYDGMPLAAGPVPIRSTFFTSATSDPAAPVAVFSEPTCDDVVALLAAHCASSCCHGGEQPAMGLRLDSADALTQTAINHVAHQSETGNSAGVPFVNPDRFGVSMPIIAAANAPNSYLVYKLMVRADNLLPCAGDACAFAALPGADRCVPLSAEETTRLAGWFVPGEPMPPLTAASSCGPRNPGPLDCGAMRAITRWIDAGAQCP